MEWLYGEGENWALELERGRMDEQGKEKAWVKEENPYLLIKAVETHTCIDENPVIRVHDLCFDKTCQGNRLALRAVAGCEKRFV